MDRRHLPLLVVPALLIAAPATAAPPTDPDAPSTSAPAPEGPDIPPDEFEENPPVEDYEDPIRAALTPVPGGLTAAQAGERASADAPTVMSAQADLELAAARVDQTIYRYLPLVKMEGSYTRLSPVDINFGTGGGALVGAANEGPLGVGPCDPMMPAGPQCVLDAGGVPVGAAAFGAIGVPLNNWSIQGTLSVPISDYFISLVPAKKAADASVEAAEIYEKAEKYKVETDTKVAYYNWVRAKAQVALARQSLANIEASVEDAKASFAAGLTNKSSVMQLEAQVASTKTLIAESEAFEELARQNLAILMGDEDANYEIGEDVLGPVPTPTGSNDLKALKSEALSNRYELRALGANIDAAEYGIRATRAEYYPKLAGFAEFTYANPNQRFFPATNEWNISASVGASLSITMNQFFTTKGTLREYRAQKRQLQAQELQLRRGVELEVTSAYTDLKKALASVRYSEQGVVAAEEAYRVQVDLYRVGSATTTDIIVAETSRVQAELTAINANIDVRVAAAKLEYATGRTQRD